MSLSAEVFPGHWKVVPIQDVVFFQEGPGVRKYQYTSSGIKLLNGGNINDGMLDLSTTGRFISEEEAYGKYSHFLVEDGDLLIACSGVVVEKFDGKIAFVKKEHLPLCMNTSTMRFRSLNNEVLNIDYFRHFLATDYFKIQLQKLITGSAQLNFGPSHIRQMVIPLPPLAEQKRIATILGKADDLRRKRQQAIDLADQFLRSVFLEMFGDPVTNPKGWPLAKMDTLVDCQLGKMLSKKSKLGESPKKYLRNANVRWGYFELDDLLEMDFSTKEKVKFELKNGDILVCEGGEIGRCAIWRDQLEDCYFQKALHRVRVGSEVLPEYMQQYFYWMSILGGFSKAVSEVTFSHLTSQKLKQLDVPVPPKELQEKFTQICARIDQLKSRLVQMKSEKYSLFYSVSQKSFRGEL